MAKDTLQLFLKFKWYDLIESGKKKVEYRKIKPYYDSRLLIEPDDGSPIRVRQYKSVVFHRGFTNTTMEWQVTKIDMGHGDVAMGADAKYPVYRIHLGKRIR